jgi:hypothetical protein
MKNSVNFALEKQWKSPYPHAILLASNAQGGSHEQ